MKIKINIQIFAIALVLILTKQIEVYAWLMLFALIHELAHMCAGLSLKLKPKALEVQAFGISIVFESFENLEKNKIIIASAGPFINILIAILFSFIHIKASSIIVNTNVLLAILNLVPIYPLDGGRIIKEILHICIGLRKSEKYTYMISKTMIILLTAISSVVILYIRNISILIIVVYLWILMIIEKRRYDTKRKIRKIQQLQQVANRDLEKNLQIK